MLNFEPAAQELVKLLILKDQFNFVCHSLTIRRLRKKSSIRIHRNVPISVYLSLTFEWAPCLVIGGIGATLRTKIRAMLLEGHRLRNTTASIRHQVPTEGTSIIGTRRSRQGAKPGTAFPQAVVFRAAKQSRTVPTGYIEDADLSPGRRLAVCGKGRQRSNRRDS
jgi:hypothetical protein